MIYLFKHLATLRDMTFHLVYIAQSEFMVSAVFSRQCRTLPGRMEALEIPDSFRFVPQASPNACIDCISPYSAGIALYEERVPQNVTLILTERPYYRGLANPTRPNLVML